MQSNRTSAAPRAHSRPLLTLRGPQPKPKPPDINRFYFVWSPERSRPRYRHATSEAALAEAARLTAQHPGVPFIAYEARALVEVQR